MKLISRFLLLFICCWAPNAALADWTLDNALSRLSFVSIKATDIGEVHKFSQLAGRLSEKGQAQVDIQLASVDTLIPIRDERMRSVLFETNKFPTATVTTNLDPQVLETLAPGAVIRLTSEAQVRLKDLSVAVTLELLLAKTDSNTLVVASLAPVIVTAAQMGVAEEVEQLRELAGLPNISQAVPVSFVLTFKQTPL